MLMSIDSSVFSASARETLDILSKNIGIEAEKAQSIAKCRRVHISECAFFLASFFESDELFFTSESFIENYQNIVRILFPYAEKGFAGGLPNILFRAELCSKLCDIYLQQMSCDEAEFLKKLLSINDYNIFSFGFDNCVIEHPYSVAMLKSLYSDMAFELFFQHDNRLYPSYQSDFNDVCEEVFYNRAEACLLPIVSSDDGQLAGFRALIDKYDLKIARTCIVSPESGSSTKFALLKKTLEAIPQCENIRLEIKTVLTDELDLPGLLLAAQHIGASTGSVISQPSHFGSELAYNIVFICPTQMLPLLLAFLFLEVPQFILYGIYYNINEQRS